MAKNSYGSAKDVSNNKQTSAAQTQQNKNTSSVKTIYSGLPASRGGSTGAKGSKTGIGTRQSSSGRTESRNTKSSSVKNYYADFTENRSVHGSSNNNVDTSVPSGRQGRSTTSTKSFYNEQNERDFVEDYTSRREKRQKENEEKVNWLKLIYGIGEQGANSFVGDMIGAADMFIGTPYQKSLDYVEEKLNLPDLGVNAISAYNHYLQKSSKEEAKHFAENASKNEFARIANEYGSRASAILPTIAAVIASSGMSAGAQGLSAAASTTQSLGKGAAIMDAVKKSAAKAATDPNAILAFTQTSGNLYNRALSEGASEGEAFRHALMNGALDASLTAVGLGQDKRGLESLPQSLKNAANSKSKAVKESLLAAAQEAGEGQIRGVAERASRAGYDKNVKFYSAQDPNAVINPKLMLQNAAVDVMAPAAMSGAHAATKAGTRTLANQVSRMQSFRYMEELMSRDKNMAQDHALSQAILLQKLTSGIVLEPQQLDRLDMKNPVIQKFYTEKTGIPFSSFDNMDERVLSQKFNGGAIKAKKSDIAVNNTPKNVLEQWWDERYNKEKLNQLPEYRHADWTKNVILEDGTHFMREERRKVLKANTSYISGKNHYAYQTDHLARPTNATCVLRLSENEMSDYRNGNTPEKIKGHDDAGHIIGKRFAGSGSLDNLLSQCANINRGEYRVLEDKWADALKAGKEVYVDFDIHYPGNSKRPDWYDITYYIDGEYTSKRIFNPKEN